MANVNGTIPAMNVMGRGAQSAGDPSMGIVGRPRYFAFLREGLTMLASDTPFDKRNVEEVVPQSGIVQLPRFMSGLRNVYLYNQQGQTVRLIQKENFNINECGVSFENNAFMNWYDYTQDTLGWFKPLGLNTYGIYKGYLFIAPNYLQWPFIRIEYAGLGFGEFCQEETLCVPIWAEEALADYIAMRALEHRIYTDGKELFFQRLYMDKKNEYKSATGSWMDARTRWSALDQKDMQDLVVIMTGIGNGM